MRDEVGICFNLHACFPFIPHPSSLIPHPSSLMPGHLPGISVFVGNLGIARIITTDFAKELPFFCSLFIFDSVYYSDDS